MRLYGIDGRPWDVDYENPNYESHTVAAVKKLIQPGWVCYDVGANVGFYTFLLAQLVGPTGVVIAFEPWPAAWEQLERALQQQSDKKLCRIVPIPEGLSYVSQRRRCVRLGKDWELLDAVDGEVIDLVLLDDLVFDVGLVKPQFIKIDIDGYESRMLRGAQRVLRECKPLIVIELAAQAHEHHGQDVKDAIRTLNACGYHLFHEDTNEDLTMAAGSPEALVQTYVPKGGSINVIARPV